MIEFIEEVDNELGIVVKVPFELYHDHTGLEIALELAKEYPEYAVVGCWREGEDSMTALTKPTDPEKPVLRGLLEHMGL